MTEPSVNETESVLDDSSPSTPDTNGNEADNSNENDPGVMNQTMIMNQVIIMVATTMVQTVMNRTVIMEIMGMVHTTQIPV